MQVLTGHFIGCSWSAQGVGGDADLYCLHNIHLISGNKLLLKSNLGRSKTFQVCQLTRIRNLYLHCSCIEYKSINCPYRLHRVRILISLELRGY